ncbi:MAG: ABC transporter permease [Blastocatellia bacterium]|nr:ABC transporter permease [Blastocatellia bacterium]
MRKMQSGEETGAPAIPHLVIEAEHGLSALDPRDLWRYRELFYFLTWRDVKIRYKQTALGAGWAILQPLFNMLLFTAIFGRMANMPSDGIPYPLFAFAGLLPWTFFSNTIGTAGNSLVANANLITKVYFPRIIIPGAAVLAGLVDFAVAFLVMAALLIGYGAPPTVGMLLVPVLALLTSLLAMGVGMLLASLNVQYRDIRYVIPFLVTFWMFATPIIYPASMMTGIYRRLLQLNPMTGFIEAWRVALLGGVNGARFDWGSLGVSAGMTGIVLLVAFRHFRQTEKAFADIV